MNIAYELNSNRVSKYRLKVDVNPVQNNKIRISNSDRCTV